MLLYTGALSLAVQAPLKLVTFTARDNPYEKWSISWHSHMSLHDTCNLHDLRLSGFVGSKQGGKEEDTVVDRKKLTFCNCCVIILML